MDRPISKADEVCLECRSIEIGGRHTDEGAGEAAVFGMPTALVAAVRKPVTAILLGNSAQVISPTMMPLSSPSAES